MHADQKKNAAGRGLLEVEQYSARVVHRAYLKIPVAQTHWKRSIATHFAIHLARYLLHLVALGAHPQPDLATKDALPSEPHPIALALAALQQSQEALDAEDRRELLQLGCLLEKREVRVAKLSAMLAQYAAGAVLALLRSPSPP